MNPSMAVPDGRIPSLDGLRAISILLVIVAHLSKRQSGPMILLSSFGVHVFFVLSGFLITTLLQSEYERHGRISLAGFYRRRCFRIFPAAFTYIFLVALLFPSSRSGLPYAITYTVSYHYWGTPLLFRHLWSLSVEEQFYLLWPLALVLAFRFRARIAWIAMIAAAACRLAFWLNPSAATIAYLHTSFPGTMDSVAAGCLLAIYWPQLRGRWQWMTESPAIVIAVPLTAWTIETVCWDGVPSIFFGIVPLLIASWVLLLVQRRDRILNNPVAYAIGVLSYSLYLWQEPFTSESKHSIVVSLLMLSTCAVASYFLVEKPMLRAGKFFTSRARRRKVYAGGIEPSMPII